VFKKIILTVMFITLAAAVVTGLFCEDYVQRYFPGFVSINFASFIIIIIGFLYAFIERSIIVPIVFFFVACALPWIKYWVLTYWGGAQILWQF